jgi:hypothetical protein
VEQPPTNPKSPRLFSDKGKRSLRTTDDQGTAKPSHALNHRLGLSIDDPTYPLISLIELRRITRMVFRISEEYLLVMLSIEQVQTKDTIKSIKFLQRDCTSYADNLPLKPVAEEFLGFVIMARSLHDLA